MSSSRTRQVSEVVRPGVLAAAVVATLGAGSTAGAGSYTVSTMKFTTVNSASWTLKGLNGSQFGTPVVESLTTPTSLLNPFDTIDPSNLPGTVTDLRQLSSPAQGDLWFDAYNWDFPGLFDWDYFGFIWDDSAVTNTGFWIEAVFNVTFSGTVTFETGSSGYTDNPIVSVNGAALNAGDVLTAGTYTFVWDYNNLSASTNSGINYGLFFSGGGTPPSAVPGSGLAAVGSLGLAGLARRRRRH